MGRITVPSGGGGGGAAAPAVATYLADVAGNGSATVLDFNSIPAGYNRLRVKGALRCAGGGLGLSTVMTFNGASTGFDSSMFRNNGSALQLLTPTNNGPEVQLGYSPQNGNTANVHAHLDMTIFDYGSGQLKHGFSRLSYLDGAQSYREDIFCQFQWRSTAAIAAISIGTLPGAPQAWATTARLFLYGET